MNRVKTPSSDDPNDVPPAAIIDAPLGDSFAIETPRLRLRPVRASDDDELFAAVCTSLAELSRWLPWCQDGYTREACRAWLCATLESWQASREFALLIEDRQTGRFIGLTGLNRIDVLGRWGNLGYWLRTDAAGNGIATEAAAAVVPFGFGRLRLRRIEIFADVENHASRRVAEKIGATFEGIARNRASVGDRCRDAAVYSLIPGDV